MGKHAKYLQSTFVSMRAEALCPVDWALSDHDSLPTRSSLLGRLRNLDDEASWRMFFETYWRLIYNVARKSGLADAESQDVVQETVIAVARKMPGFQYDPGKGSFKQWLLLITRRRIHDHFRRLYRSANAASQDDESAAAIECLPDPGLGPDATIDAVWEAAWHQHLLETALARLRQQANPKHYQAFDYCVLQNLPPSQVGTMLGLNIAQVYLAKHRIGRALKRIVAAIDAEVSRRSVAR